MFMMKVHNLQINLDACPAFRVWQDGDNTHISIGKGFTEVLKNVRTEEVHRAIAYKVNHDARHFDLEKTIHFMRRTYDGD